MKVRSSYSDDVDVDGVDGVDNSDASSSITCDVELDNRKLKLRENEFNIYSDWINILSIFDC